MQGFFDDLDENDLDILDEMELPAVAGPAGGAGAAGAPGEADEEQRKDGRTVEYFYNFTVGQSTAEPESKCLRIPTADGSLSEYLIIKHKIGKGAFCKVQAADVAVYRPGNAEGEQVKGVQHMALKVFNKASLRSSATTDVDPVTGISKLSNQLKTVMNEIKVWERVYHPNIVKIFELFDSPSENNMYLMMELAQYGQIQKQNPDGAATLLSPNQEILQTAVTKGKKIWPAATCRDIEHAGKWIFQQVAVAMEYLHETMGVVHRDLKHENILMGLKSPDPMSEDERQPTIKVCDFTTATILPKDQPDARVQLDAGTLAFNAPEQLNDADYLAKPLDVWAFGVSLYAYLTNSLPVNIEGSHQQFVKDHNEANFEEIVNNLDVTTDLKDLLKSILDRNPQQRPSFQEILKSKWFAGRVDEVFSTEIDTYAQKKKVDFLSLKPIIQEKARKYFNKDELRDQNYRFLMKMAQMKQSHEFFRKIENELELEVNRELTRVSAFKKFVQVDVKIQDQFLPPWLIEQLKSARYNRYYKTHKRSMKARQNNSSMQAAANQNSSGGVGASLQQLYQQQHKPEIKIGGIADDLKMEDIQQLADTPQGPIVAQPQSRNLIGIKDLIDDGVGEDEELIDPLDDQILKPRHNQFELSESPGLRQSQQQQIMVNMQVSSANNQAADANEDFQPSNLVNGEAGSSREPEPQLNPKQTMPTQRDLSHLDTDSTVFFNEAIFTMRCSVRDIEIGEQLYDQLAVANCLFENPGSYPTLFNELDVLSILETSRTDSLFVSQMSSTVLSHICSYLGLKDSVQSRQLNKKFQVAANLAIHGNIVAFKASKNSFGFQSGLPLPETQYSFEQRTIQTQEANEHDFIDEYMNGQNELIKEVLQRAKKLGLVDLLQLLEFPNVNYSLLFQKGCPERLLKYLALKFKQLSPKLQHDSPNALKHLLQIMTLSSSLVSFKESNQDVYNYILALHLHFTRVRYLNFFDARLLGQFEADVALQQQLEESRLKEKMSGFAKGTQSRRHFRVSFNSKALSKYVLQNVMQFFYWKTDSYKCRQINKKFKEAYDMHLVNLSMIVQIQLYDKYTMDQIREGEEKLCKVYQYMTAKEAEVENFSLQQFEEFSGTLSRQAWSPEQMEELRKMLSVQCQKDLILSKCLTAMISISGTEKKLKVKPTKNQNFTSHLRQFNYYGTKPTYDRYQWLYPSRDEASQEADNDVELNLKSLPQTRLSSFLNYIEFYGPSHREVLDFIKQAFLQKRASKHTPPSQNLPDEQVLPLLRISSRHLCQEQPNQLNSENFVAMNAALSFAESYSLTSNSRLELQILVSFLHLHKYAKTMNEMKNKSHLFQHILLRNQMQPDQKRINHLISVFGLQRKQQDLVGANERSDGEEEAL